MNDKRHKLFIGLGALLTPVIAHLLLSLYYSDAFVVSNAYYLHCFFLMPMVAVAGAILGAKYDIYLREKQESEGDQIIEDLGLPKKGIEKRKLTAKHMASDVGHSLVGMMAGAAIGLGLIVGVIAITVQLAENRVISSDIGYLLLFIGIIFGPFVFMFFVIKGTREGMKLSESKRSNNQSSLQESDNARRDSFYEVSNSDEKKSKDDSPNSVSSRYSLRDRLKAGSYGFIWPWFISFAYFIHMLFKVGPEALFSGGIENNTNYLNFIFWPLIFSIPCALFFFAIGTNEND